MITLIAVISFWVFFCGVLFILHWMATRKPK
jgi:hypothetical protein